MLILLILCGILHWQTALSTSPHHSDCGGDVLNLVTRDSPATPGDGTQNSRTRWAILQSCLLTIFACVWTAIHPNINGPRDSWWTCFKRKVTTTLIALIAPELILSWALDQRVSAQELADKYNGEFAASAGDSKSLLQRILGCFRLLPKSATYRGDGQQWTVAHGFFLQMGGFLLYENGYPTEVLNYERLEELIRNKSIDPPTITEREIQDRSKGDTISKGIVVWQTTWFAVQCCARLQQHLPLSELEVVTLAFTVVNLAIYAAWWDKPQSVDTALCLPLKIVEKPTNPPADEITSAGPEDVYSPEQFGLGNTCQREHATDDGQSSMSTADRPLIPKDEPVGEESWLRLMLRKDRRNYTPVGFFLFRLPYRIFVSLFRLLGKLGGPERFNGKRLRMPMFYTSSETSNKAILSLAVVGVLFGAVHLIPWDAAFPSPLDRVLWRCASIALTSLPAFFFLWLIIEELDSHTRSGAADRVLEVLRGLVGYGSMGLLLFYIPARFVVVIVALRAIQHPSADDILRDVTWTSYIPHL